MLKSKFLPRRNFLQFYPNKKKKNQQQSRLDQFRKK